MNSEGVEFWYNHLGRFMSDVGPEKSGKAAVPTWLGKDDPESIAKGKGVRVAPWPIGAKIPLFYIVTPSHAWVFGKVALESNARVTYRVGSADERVDGRREIVRWLLAQCETPFMVGVVTEANPNPSFKVTHHPTRGFFCESSGGFTFNLEVVRADLAKLEGKPWKEVATLIYRYDEMRNAEQGTPERDKAKDSLMKLLKKMPEMQTILPTLKVKPYSGEMELLRLAMS